MVKNIVKDEYILVKKSEKFIPGEDDYIIDDMLDTANEHGDNCAGLAAVQIGYLKRVILVKIGDKFIPFINPVITKKFNGTYTTTEGCLSLEGGRVVVRHRGIRVKFTDRKGKTRIEPYTGYIAQILQHEIDHLNGVLI